MRPTEKCKLRSHPEKKADFVEPMECEPVSRLPDSSQWVYEIKLDGYRAIAVKSDGKVRLFSRRQKSFNQQYPYVVEALADLPDGTVIDGEIVALDDSARPQFNLLQNYQSEAHRIRYFVFDLLCYDNRDTTSLPLIDRRALLRKLKFKSPRIQFLDFLETSAANMVAAAKQQGLEGVVAKRKDSLYQPGRRTGAWVKYRINRGQEFVIGGYFPGTARIRFDHRGLLRGQEPDVRCADTKRICPGVQATTVFKVEASRDAKLPVRKSAGDRALKMGRGT